MIEASTTTLFLLFSAAVGAIHVFLPDHWFPASFMSWQRRWTFRKTLQYLLALFGTHVVFGIFLSLLFIKGFPELSSRELIGLSLLILGGGGIIRYFRLPRMREILQAQPTQKWSPYLALVLIGPSESMIPLILKAPQFQVSWLSVIFAYGMGTLVSGAFWVWTMRVEWDRPQALARSLQSGWGRRILS